jgi:hypothetical protein
MTGAANDFIAVRAILSLTLPELVSLLLMVERGSPSSNY